MQCSYFKTTPDRTEYREVSVPTFTIYGKHNSIKITTEFFFKENSFVEQGNSSTISARHSANVEFAESETV